MPGIKLETNLSNFFEKIDESFEAKYGIAPKAYLAGNNILMACSNHPQSKLIKQSTLTKNWEWRERKIFFYVTAFTERWDGYFDLANMGFHIGQNRQIPKNPSRL